MRGGSKTPKNTEDQKFRKTFKIEKIANFQNYNSSNPIFPVRLFSCFLNFSFGKQINFR
jgi:hypothetical protein